MSTLLDFDDDWYGWKLRGRELVSPDRQRISRTRLEGLLWRDAMELRLAGYASRRKAEAAKVAAGRRQLVKVVVVELGEYRRHGVGAA
ncbi:hypothetical protein [Lysobacter sp. D1-1-M9]|uniref:hypothetical protein n=1 Tax=Novilysobacter longmucuonensis TaxID=3098603 RepID=UPI002FC7C5AF